MLPKGPPDRTCLSGGSRLHCLGPIAESGHLEQSLWHGGWDHPDCLDGWSSPHAQVGSSLKPGVSWESGTVCLGWGEAGGAANKAPRDAGGLVSVFTALNKQLYILIEAEETLIGCMGTFVVSQGGKKAI